MIKKVEYVVLAAVIIYIAAYFGLSLGGRYEPAIIGLNGVKSYGWAPYGFAQANGHWNRSPMLFFAPCYILDIWLWHTSGRSDGEKYPVHEMTRDDAIKTYLIKKDAEPPAGLCAP